MRIAVLADVHAADDLSMAKMLPTGFSDRLLDIDACLRAALASNVDMVIVCGDLYHKRLLDAPTSYVITRTLSQDWGKPIYILPGNHDAHDASGRHYNVNYLGLNDSNSVVVINEPKVIKNPPGGGRLVAMPYYPERLAKEHLKKLHGDILFCHQTFAGCSQGGWISKSGLTADDYKQFKLVVAGHFHEQQEFKRGFYVGSLTQLGWTETPEKGYYILEVSQGDVISYEHIGVENSPVFWNVDWCDTIPDANELVSKLNMWVDGEPCNGKDNYCHIDFECDADEAPQLKTMIQQIILPNLPKTMRALRWNIKLKQSHTASNNAQKPSALPPLEVLMRDYVEKDKTLASGTNTDKLLEVGNNILEAARK